MFIPGSRPIAPEGAVSAAPVSRRALLAGVAAFTACQTATSAVASPAGRDGATRVLPDFDAATRLRHWMRLTADVSGVVCFAHTSGVVYGFLSHADDLGQDQFATPLYGYEAVVARQVVAHEGNGWRLRQRGWSHYTDAITGALIEALDNPYTGRRVQCPPMAAPVSESVYTPAGRLRTATPFPLTTSDQHEPFTLHYAAAGERVSVRRGVVARFRPTNSRRDKLEADITVHDVRRGALLDDTLTHVQSTFMHNLVAEWQTWMDMAGTPGHILFSGLGRSLPDLASLDTGLFDALQRHFPGTLAQTQQWSPDMGL